LLAVHCGLGLYGRNNICYNEKFGSYMQIMSYISDLPCEQTAWLPIKRMNICEECRACVVSCATGVIDPRHELIIDTERCLAHLNESPGEFPDWLDKNAHNSLFGCMKCQDCCPANAQNKNNIVMGTTFTEKETTEILSHKADEPFSDSLVIKLEAAGLSPEEINNMPRNLSALLQKSHY